MIGARSAAALFPLLLTACAGTPTAEEQARADRVARALARATRLDYDLRLAAAGHGKKPTGEELRVAERELTASLEAAGIRAPRLASAAEEARNLLVRRGWVFLPTARHADPGLALARVVARTSGLSRELWGKTVRYRRVVHAGPMLPDFVSYVTVRLGKGPLPPAGRFSGPTVYLDRAALERRAGRPGPYATLSAAELEAEEELRQVAAMRFAGLIPVEELIDPKDAGRSLTRLHGLILVTLLRYGDGPVWRAVVARLSQGGGPAPLVAAARRIKVALRRKQSTQTIYRELLAEVRGRGSR